MINPGIQTGRALYNIRLHAIIRCSFKTETLPYRVQELPSEEEKVR